MFSFRVPLLRAAGRWLDIAGAETPPRAGLIYVYAGGEAERPQYAAGLFKSGVAPRLMTAGGLKTDKLIALGIRLTEGEVNREVLIKSGVPPGGIICVRRGASTLDETNILHGYMKSHGIKSAVLVTSNFHTRRVRMTARKVFGKDNVKIYYAAPHGRVITDLDAWWREEDDMITVVNEYIKLSYYLYKYILR